MEDNGAENSEDIVPQVNIDTSGVITRTIHHGATLCFLTQLEVIELLIRRHDQLNEISGKFNNISPVTIEKVGTCASLLVLMLAELIDDTIEYPLMVKRGEQYLRVHKDLIVMEEIVNIVVLTNEDGEVSFNSVYDDIKNRPGAELRSLEKDLAMIEKIRMSIARHVI